MRATLVAVLALLTFAPSAMAVDEVNTKKFRQDVTVNGIMSHERALQSIANANGGTRASGTPGLRCIGRVRLAAAQEGRLQGHRAGVHLPVLRGARRLDALAGLADPREGLRDRRRTSTRAAATSPPRCSRSTSWCRSGTRPPSTSTSGCEPADFADFTAGNVALIQRGTCDFAVKAENAEAAGASAVIIFNEGQPGRHRPARRHARRQRPRHPGARPELRRRRRARRVCARADDDRPRVRRRRINETRPTKNVIADSKTGDTGQDARRRLAPRLGARGPGHQRQRQRQRDGPRDRRGDGRGQDQAAPARAVRVLGRRGVRPAGLRALRREPHRRSQVGQLWANLNFDMLGVAELRAVRL